MRFHKTATLVFVMAELTVICKLSQFPSSCHLTAENKTTLAGNSVEKQIGLMVLVTMNIVTMDLSFL
jgi:hypothetical protein